MYVVPIMHPIKPIPYFGLTVLSIMDFNSCTIASRVPRNIGLLSIMTNSDILYKTADEMLKHTNRNIKNNAFIATRKVR